MYKVLIVEDEVLVRVGLKTTIDWEAIGFTVVAEASNGEQGFEQYKKYDPDVIITDIKMPKRDGLWLIERVRKENNDVKILVLTCYDEFSYVRNALKAGADDYILKSEVEDEELIALMKSIKNKIDKQSNATMKQKKVRININDIKRVLLNDMIKTDFIIDDKINERCLELGFTIFDTKFVFVSIAIQEEIFQNKSDTNSFNQNNNAIANIIFDKLVDRGIEYIYNKDMNKYIFLMSSAKLSLVELNRIFTSVKNASSQYFDISLNIVYTDPFENIEKAFTIYENFIQKEQILFYENEKSFFIVNINNVNFYDVNVFDLRKRYNKIFIEYMGQEKLKNLNNLTVEMSEYFKKDNINPMVVKIFYSNLIGDIFNNYEQLFEENEEIMDYEDYHYKIINSKNLESIIRLVSKFISDILSEIKLSRYKNSKWIISKALYFIENNYDKRISLEDVACELNLSKHYLCNVFKKETGENMSLYINKLRIEKAKYLLLKTDYKVKEIFEDVGYANQQYFSKVFKKITGITISKYRENTKID